MYDIAIIGLGPAGAIFAKYLDKNLKVIAIDKKSPADEKGFIKPCGGLLAPDAQKSLSRFNMTLPKDVLVSPQIFSVRTIDVKSGQIRHYQRHYINLDRNKFDSWLISLIPDFVEIKSRAVCLSVSKEKDCFRIVYEKDGQINEVFSKYIVGADGANSIVRRSLFKDFKIRAYLTVQQLFSDAHDTPFYSCVFDPDITDSYAWGLTKDRSFIFGGAFDIKTGKRDFEDLKEKMTKYGFKLNNPQKTEACLVLRPFGPRNYCYGKDGAFFIGEAAGFISPSSLEGISYAIDSGYILSRCLSENLKNPDLAYRKATRGIRLKLTSKYVKRPFMYNYLSRNIIMKSGVGSVNVIK